MALGFRPLGSAPLASLPAADGTTGTLAWTETVDAWAMGATIGSGGAIAWTEAVDVYAIVAQGVNAAPIAWTEAVDAWAVVSAGTILVPVIVKVAPFYATDTITTAGYQLYYYAAGVRTADGGHHTTGIDTIPSVTNGYQVPLYLTGMTLDTDGGYRGSIVWDSGGGSPIYVADEVYVPPTKAMLDMTQAVPTSNTAQTVGDALNAARAQGFGKWVLTGTSLALYAADGTTVVKTLTLDSSSAPTQRV